MNNTIRLGTPSDFQQIKEWDEFWGDRRQEIQKCELFVSCTDSGLVQGFITITSSDFFNFPLISYICVKREYRRKEIASSLLVFINHRLYGSKHFASTEKNNYGANMLFKSLGYLVAGELAYLDDEKEVIYVKLENQLE